MGITLGRNQYGKAENRVVRVYRDAPRHEIRDLNVSTSLRGDFADAHMTGNQGAVLPTDTQKNTVYAYAKEVGISSPEAFGIALGARYLEACPSANAARIALQEFTWERLVVDGKPHDHSFVRRGPEHRTAVVTTDDSSGERRVFVIGGVSDLVVLKSTGSGFVGFLKDKYTTLQETTDRIMSTSMVVRWRYNTTDVDWDAAHADIKALMLEVFAREYSEALQQTLYQMGEAVLKARPEVDEVMFSAPNKHHFVVDLSPFGLENDNEVFYAADRPYGLIEATVTRDDATDAGDAWLGTPGFC
jgi:urate oxidase